MPTVIDQTTLGSETMRHLTPSKRDETVKLTRAGTLWDQGKFNLGSPPLIIDEIGYPEHLIVNTRVLDLPVKTPSGSSLVIPEEVAFASGFCQRVIDHVYSTLPSQFEQTYAYLTVDEGLIPPHRTQRHGGLHVDGFQGGRIGDALPTDFSFIAWFGQGAPTKFYPYGFDCDGLDRDKDNFSAFWTQSAHMRSLRPLYAKPSTIYGMDAYTIHESGINSSNQDIYRLFFRLSFSVREFDRLGNTMNPFLPLGWKYASRNVSAELNTRFFERLLHA